MVCFDIFLQKIGFETVQIWIPHCFQSSVINYDTFYESHVLEVTRELHLSDTQQTQLPLRNMKTYIFPWWVFAAVRNVRETTCFVAWHKRFCSEIPLVHFVSSGEGFLHAAHKSSNVRTGNFTQRERKMSEIVHLDGLRSQDDNLCNQRLVRAYSFAQRGIVG